MPRHTHQIASGKALRSLGVQYHSAITNHSHDRGPCSAANAHLLDRVRPTRQLVSATSTQVRSIKWMARRRWVSVCEPAGVRYSGA